MAAENPYVGLVEVDGLVASQVAAPSTGDMPTMGGQANPYVDQVQGDTARAVRESMSMAVDSNPDTEARLQALSKKYKVPLESVRLESKTMERRDKLDSFDYTKLASQVPATANLLSDPAKAAIAQDDVENLGAIETAIRFAGRGANAAKAGLLGASSGVVGVVRAPFELAAPILDPLTGTILPENPLRRVASGLTSYQQSIEAQANAAMPQGEGNVEQGVYSGIASLSRNLAGLPLAFLPGGQPAALTFMTAPVFGQEYNKAREKGISPLGATTFGASQAAIEYATEKIPLSKLLGDIKVGTSFLKTLAKQAAFEVPGEQIATILQDLNEWSVINPDKPFSDYIKARPDAAVQTLVATLIGVGGQTTVVTGIDKAIQLATGENRKAQNAEADSEQIGKMIELVNASNVLRRDKQTFQAFLQEAERDGPVTDVFINAQVFAQSALDAGIEMDQLPASVQEQLSGDIAPGVDLRIPMSEFMADIAPMTFAQSLIDHVKTDENGYSRTEAQAYMASEGDTLQAEIDRVLGEKAQDDTFKESRERVKQDFLGQINTTGRFSAAKNEVDATVFAAHTAVRAAQIGITPEEYAAKFKLVVSGQAAGGQAFEQGGQIVTDTPAFKEWFGDSKVVDGQGKPVVVYHGTQSDVTEFSDEFFGEGQGNADWGDGFYFTDDPNAANTYAQGDGGNVMPMYLSIKNPATNEVMMSPEVQAALQDDMGFMSVQEVLESMGYDGIEITHDGGKKEYVAFDNTQMKSQFNRGTFDGGDSNVLNQFAGVNAKGADIYALTNAEERLAKGESSERVRKETGWFKGVDGLWRFEIADNEAKFVSRLENRLEAEKVIEAEYADKIVVIPDPKSPTLFKAMVNEGAPDYLGAFGKTSDDARSNLITALAKRTTNLDFSIGDVKAGFEYSLREILNHPKLYAAYPDIAEIKVSFIKDRNYKGVYYPGEDEIGLSITSDNDGMLSTLLHEIQHAIQHREGYARGGNTDNDFTKTVQSKLMNLEREAKQAVSQWRWNNQDVINEAERTAQVARFGLMFESAQRLNEYANRDKPSGVLRLIRNNLQWTYTPEFNDLEVARQLQRDFWDIPKSSKMRERNAFLGDMAFRGARMLLDSIPQDLRQQFENDPRTMKGMISALQRESNKANKALKPLQEAEKTRRNAETVSQTYRNSTPYDIYKALAGEVEARNTQARQQMTDEERVANPPQKTADVPAEQTVVMFGGMDVQAPMAAFPAMAQQNRGQISFNPNVAQSPAVMSILQGADLSTVQHELAHFFLETDIALAAQINQNAELVGVDALRLGEQEILADVSSMFNWFGFNGTLTEQIAQWSNLPFEEKRAYHERTAESFEKYLFEGKAPSFELQPYFQKMAAWFKSVYKSVKEFLAKNPEAGKIDDTVRAVFDRMLASTEEIQSAELGRSMMPLFSAAEQAGMDSAEFADYQKQDIQATQDAIDDLQAKGMRDMQWLTNARSREIKRLQKESAGLRRQMRIEARAQIMSQPVYRAWQFLTGKLTKTDRVDLAREPLPKSPADTVVPEIDSLFVAIAKLGGLRFPEVQKQWGWDTKERSPIPVFGKPVIRREGGMSMDDMAQSLADFGYLPLDENGKADQRDLEELFYDEYGGTLRYSNSVDPRIFTDDRLSIAGTENMNAGRLSKSEVETYFSQEKEILAKVVELNMTANEGFHPDYMADVFGFESGGELLNALATSESHNDAIEALTDQLMLENYGELSSPEAIASSADQAIFNEARAKFTTTQANALAKATGGPRLLASAAKEYATKIIDKLMVKNIKPNLYAQAQARAAKAASAALRSGDLEVAASETRNQAINNYAAKIANDSIKEVDKIRREFALVNKGNNKALVEKGRDPDIANVARAVLATYGVGARTEKSVIQYLEVVKTNDPVLYSAIEPIIVDAQANAKPLNDLTMPELRELREQINSLWFLSKRTRQMEIDGKLVDINQVEGELSMKLDEQDIPDVIPGEETAITKKQAFVQSMQFAGALLKRVENWSETMDGSFGGPFLRFIFQPIKEAANRYRTERLVYRKRYTNLVDSIKNSMTPELIKAPELNYTFGGGHNGMGMAEVLHAILHTGNESNKRKLLLGRKWATENLDGSIDTTRWDTFINRMIREGKLTQVHYEFAQGVWDMLEDMKGGAQKAHRDVFGRYFDEVSAKSFITPFGTYRGGYVPAMADPRIVQDAALREMAETENESMAYAFPATAKGFTKGRVEYNRPLILDLRTIGQHMDKVLLFTHMEAPVRDVRRALTRKGVSQKLSRLDPSAYSGMLLPWLNRSARQQVETPILGDGRVSRLLSVARNRAGMALMFGNVSNSIQQIAGFAVAAIKVDKSQLMRATAQYLKAPKQMADYVSDASPFMRDRMANEIASINDQMNQILLNPTLVERGQAWTQKHAYFMQSAIDNVMSPIVWTGAYNQAIEQGMVDAQAIRFADGVVRQTQGSTLPEDVSRIETGPAYARVFTQFIGYFNMVANTNASELQKIARDVGLRKGAGRALGIVFYGILVNAWVAEAITVLFRGGPEDEDEDGYLDDWIMSVVGMGTLKTVLAGVPFVGQAANVAINKFNNNPLDDRASLSPAVSLLESSVGAPYSVYNALVNEGSKARAVKDVATAVSVFTGLPAYTVGRPLSYLTGIADQKIEPTGPVDFVRGLITGTSSKQSRQ